MAPPGVPSNFEDWSVWRNFHEAGRLMTTHFHVFLPTVVYVLFPGSLISVVYWQFLIGIFSQDSSFPKWVFGSILQAVAWMVPTDVIVIASTKVLHVMKTNVYVLDAVKYRNGEYRKGETSQLLPDLICCCWDGYSGRRSRAVVVSIVCFVVYMLGLVVPVAFGFKGVTAVGMPEWTAILFTPLLAAGMSLVNLYMVLVFTLVARLWMYVGQSTRAILA